MDRDLLDGQHRNPRATKRPDWFTTAYLHRPDELARELDRAARSVELLGIEGPAWMLDADWNDEIQRAQMLFAARAVELREPSLLGISAHILAVAHAEPSRLA